MMPTVTGLTTTQTNRLAAVKARAGLSTSTTSSTFTVTGDVLGAALARLKHVRASSPDSTERAELDTVIRQLEATVYGNPA